MLSAWAFLFLEVALGAPPRLEFSCRECHLGLEKVSEKAAVHESCVSCHGGTPGKRSLREAHRGLQGAGHPASVAQWEKTCGKCHAHQLARVKSALMFTAAGMIRNIKKTWEAKGAGEYSTLGGRGFDSTGKPVELKAVTELGGLSGELFRKFCSRCHLAIENEDSPHSMHASGCAACHFPYASDGKYAGGDAAVRGKAAFSKSHQMEPLPSTRVCAQCHHRSGRIALNYMGIFDGNNSLVPTENGGPGPVPLSGGRTGTRMAPDVHYAAGMECIDCHTSRDVMGDGYLHGNMFEQVEVACEDCHGGYENSPRFQEITAENADPLRESRSYAFPMEMGMKMVLTSKGRMYSNAFLREGQIFVVSKKSGKILRSKVITGTPEHSIAGHGRMECYTCHSKTVPQCFGCHTEYNKGRKARDYVKRELTPGAFSETEDYRAGYPFSLAFNQRGRISPVTPGCQTFVSVVEEDRSFSKDEEVSRFRGKRQLRFAPFYSHNTGKSAVGCVECHSNPYFLGFGQGGFSEKGWEPSLLCECSTKEGGAPRALDGFQSFEGGHISPHAAIVREGARPLSAAEIRRVWQVNLCVVCHAQARDPIYRKELKYEALDDALHRKLLSD